MPVFKNRNASQIVNTGSLKEWNYKDMRVEGQDEGEAAKFNF